MAEVAVLTSRRLGGFHGLYDNDQIIRTTKKRNGSVVYSQVKI